MSRIAGPTALTKVILGGVLVLSWAFAVAGEPVRVGILSQASAAAPSPSVDAVTRALRELGYRHGENIVLESRYAEGKAERLPELAKELVALPVNVILAIGGEAIAASKNATSAIPIVIGTGGDFVALGWIASWDRPGGNVTGVQYPVLEAVRKRVDLFAHALGGLSRLAVLVYTPYPPSPQFLHEAEAAAKERHIQVLPIQISTAEELEAAYREAQQSGAQAVMALQAPFFFQQRQQLTALATHYKLPLAGGEPGFADAGAMLQVGPDIPGCAAGAAVFVDRLLKGAQASELPVERCRKIEVVFNHKAARALGRTIDPTLTQGARVIE
jgi:putative tryptophan/tyrosine transport system substrate-binding protein